MGEVEQGMATEIKSSGLAIVLSFFYPGLGQMYAGRIGRGLLLLFVATPAVWLVCLFGGGLGILSCAAASSSETANAGAGGGLVGMLLLMTLPAYYVWVMVDAKRLCERHNAGVPAGLDAVSSGA